MARSAYLNGLGGTVIVDTTGGGENVGAGGSSGGGNTGGGNTPSNVKPFFRLSQLETSDVNGADVFNVNHDGGRIFFIQPHLSVDSTKYPDSDWIKPQEWSSPFSVNDDKEIEIHFPYTIVEKVGTGQDFVVPEEMKNLNFSMSFEPIEDEEAQVTSSIYQGSYADITIGNLRTYSGDVHRTKIYAKRQGHTANGFFKIADFVLQPDNQLIDSASLSGKLPIGLFYTQSIVDNNWQTSSATVSATLRDTYLVGGVSLSGSNENVNDSYTFETKNNMVFTKGEDYQVLFDLQYFKADKSGSYTAENDAIITAEPHAEIEVYLSGSIESGNTDVEYSLGTFSSDETSPDFSDVLSNTSGSIRRVYNIFRTHNITNQISSGSLGFRIKSGRFDLSAISITPFVDQNFNPGFTNVSVPMPVNDEAQVRYDFLAEFYDFNNNKSIQLAETSASVLFEGPRKVISITGDDIWDGTATIGRSMKLHGSNPAFLSTIGYNGFEKTRDHSSNRERDGGVLLFSGSIGLGATENFLTASEAYEGVGLEILDASSSSSFEHRFLKFRTNPSEFTVQTNQFLLGVSGSGGAESFISSSGNILEISSSNFHLSSSGNLNVGNSAMVVTPAGDLTLQGSITATAGGQIGGFTITDKAISTTDFFLSGSTYSGTGFDKTNLVLSSSGFQINSDGQISASEGAIGGFGIGASSLSATGFFISGSSTGTGFADTNLFISSSGFQVNAVGAISASSGVIGGFGISKDSISDTAGTPKFFISGSPGATNNMADTNLFISASGFQVNSTGEISASAGVIGGFGVSKDSISDTAGTPKFFISGSPGATNNMADTNLFISASGFQVNSTGEISASAGVIGGFQISGDSISSTNIFISGSPVAGGVDDSRYKFISTTNFNVKQDGDITGSAVLFTGGKVGGFTIDEDSIEGGNLVLHSAGRVESADFSSGVMAGSGQGFRLSAEGNGFLEVENARIRGTLSTAVFEKETVNAVGGIMMIGNSTVITGSGGFSGVTASSATMSVENISGFTGSYNGFNSSGVVTNAEQIDGEILMIKKFDKDGFSTEYVCVQSASFNGDSTAQNNGTDLSGKLYVTRSFSGTAHDGVGSNQSKTGTAGFTGSYLPGGNAQNYEDGQVVVSTGKFFSGTAAGGDISGSGFIMLNAKSTDQFTPYIDIIQRTGSFVYSMELKARLGDLSGLSSGLVGTKPGFGLFTEKLFLRAENADSASIAVGGATDINTGNGFFVDGGGNFRVGGTSNNFLKFTGGTLSISVPDIDINSTDFTLDASGIDIESSDATITLGEGNLLLDGGNSIIKIGATTNKQVLIEGSSTVGKIYTGKTDVSQTTAGFWIANNDGDPEFHVGDAAEFIKFDGGALSIKSSDIDITATTFNLNANSGDLLIDSSAKTISLDGGTITLDGSGTGFLDIGNLTGVTDTASSNKGLYATGDGTLLLKAAANEFLQINNSKLSASFNSLDINTSTFDVSTANGGKLSLGSATTFGTAGVFMSGSGGVSFYQDANNYFIMTGSIMDIRSQEFNLVTTGSGGTPDKGIIMNSTQPLIMVSGSRGSVKGNSVRLLGDEGVLEVSQSGEGVFDTGRTKTFTEFTTVEFDSVRPLSFGGVDKPDVITTSGSIQAAPRMDNLDVDGVIDTVGLNTNRINVVGAGVGRADIFFKNTSPQFAMDENAATDPKPHFIFLDENDTSFAEPPNVFGNQHPSFVFHKTISGSHATDQVPVGYRSGSSGALPESGSSIFTISTTMTAQNAGDIADAQFNLLALDTNLSGIDNQHQNEYTFLQARHSGSIRAQLQHDGDFVSKGNITAFGTTFLQVSDQRLKKDIHTISGSMNKILQLRPTEFTWIDNDKQDVGFIAQEVEEIIPEVIEISDGFINTVNDQQIKTISYPKLVPYLVDTIQQLTKRIEELEKKVK